MDTVKEAFNKVKQDIEFLNKKINSLSDNLVKTREDLVNICEILKGLNITNKKIDEQNKLLYEQNKNINELVQSIFLFLNKKSENLTLETIPAIQQINSTSFPANQTFNPIFKPQNAEILNVSNGNEGVPTDRQTNQQTNQQTNFNVNNNFLKDSSLQDNFNKSSYNNNYIRDAADLLDSLDNIKKEIRLKFKKLTEQELIVFSTIYQFDEENGYSDYKLLSNRLGLTESLLETIRDD
jgi:hypothetical protein